LRKLYYDEEFSERIGVFKDRWDAGIKLSKLLEEALEDIGVEIGDTVILAIPSGGIPVCYSMCKRIGVKFDLIIVRKIPHPLNTEMGIGAMGPDGEWFIEDWILRNLPRELIDELVENVRKVIGERESLFRSGRPYPDLNGRKVILVDDGIAAGYTMMAAGGFTRRKGAEMIISAVPTACLSSARRLLESGVVDMVVSPNIRSFIPFAVADAYRTWYDVPRSEVLLILENARREGLFDAEEQS